MKVAFSLRAVGLAVLTVVSTNAAADTLMLRDGTTITGRFEGASEQTFHFRAAGEIRHLPVSRVSTLALSPRQRYLPLAPRRRAFASRALIVGTGPSQSIKQRRSIQ